MNPDKFQKTPEDLLFIEKQKEEKLASLAKQAEILRLVAEDRARKLANGNVITPHRDGPNDKNEHFVITNEMKAGAKSNERFHKMRLKDED